MVDVLYFNADECESLLWAINTEIRIVRERIEVMRRIEAHLELASLEARLKRADELFSKLSRFVIPNG